MNRRRVRASVRAATARASRRLCSADCRQFHLQAIVILARTGRRGDRGAIGAARLVDAIERDQDVAFELLRRHAVGFHVDLLQRVERRGGLAGRQHHAREAQARDGFERGLFGIVDDPLQVITRALLILVFHLDLGERERGERRVWCVALLLDETCTAIQCGRLVAAPHIIQHFFILPRRHLGLRRLVIRPHAPADDDARADHDAQQDRLAVRTPPPLDRLDLFLIRCVTFHGLSSLCSLKYGAAAFEEASDRFTDRTRVDSLTPPTARAQYPPPRIPTRHRAAFARARCAAAHRRATTSHRPTAPPPRYHPRSMQTRRRSCPRVSSGPRSRRHRRSRPGADRDRHCAFARPTPDPRARPRFPRSRNRDAAPCPATSPRPLA